MDGLIVSYLFDAFQNDLQGQELKLHLLLILLRKSIDENVTIIRPL